MRAIALSLAGAGPMCLLIPWQGATTLQGPGRKPGQLGWEEAQGEQQGIDRPGCLPLGE